MAFYLVCGANCWTQGAHNVQYEPLPPIRPPRMGHGGTIRGGRMACYLILGTHFWRQGAHNVAIVNPGVPHTQQLVCTGFKRVHHATSMVARVLGHFIYGGCPTSVTV